MRWIKARRAAFTSLYQSPSFQARQYWDGAAVVSAFRGCCRGEVEESMFFWRAANVELWLREFVDRGVVFADADVEAALTAPAEIGPKRRGSLAEAGDARVPALLAAAAGPQGPTAAAEAERLLAEYRPNDMKHLFAAIGGAVWARIPLKTDLVGRGDDLDELFRRQVVTHVKPGDIVVMAEKPIAASQGRSYALDEIHPTRLAAMGFSAMTTMSPGFTCATTWRRKSSSRSSPRPTRSVFSGIRAHTAPPMAAKRCFMSFGRYSARRRSASAAAVGPCGPAAAASSAGTRASPASARLPRRCGPISAGAVSAASTSASSSTTLRSQNSRSHSSTLAARQKNIDSSTVPRQQARNAPTTAAPSQYCRAWKDGDWYRLVKAARRALIQRISGVVKPTFQRRKRIFSGSVPLSAARRIQRLQPSRTMASAGRLRMLSTNSWSRYGTRLSMLNAMELRSS